MIGAIVTANAMALWQAVSPDLQQAIQEEVQAGGLAAVAIHDFHDRPWYKMGAIYKKGRYLSLAARSFLQELQAYFAPGTRVGRGG